MYFTCNFSTNQKGQRVGERRGKMVDYNGDFERVRQFYSLSIRWRENHFTQNKISSWRHVMTESQGRKYFPFSLLLSFPILSLATDTIDVDTNIVIDIGIRIVYYS